MLLIAVTVRALTAVIAVVAFPVVVPPTAAVVALNAVLIGGMYRHRKAAEQKLNHVFQN